jgi:uncharacterized oxidoreductase
MPALQHGALEALARDIFRAIGTPAEGAAWMARLLVRANLRGHDSHGVIRVPQYVASYRRGEADPKAEPVIVQDGPATALLDGRNGFGQIVARHGMEVAMEKAAAVGVAAVGMHRCNHIGRLADYAEMAAERDMLGFLAVNAGGAGQRMAPWGGCAPRLSTNPLAFASPTGAATPMSLDIATTVAADGKVRVKRNRGEQIPPGWVIDAEGKPVTDPNVLYGEPPGTILPMGGHKGYGLALMVEILGGILARAGHARQDPGPVTNGVFAVVLDISRFVAPGTFRREAADLMGYLKSCPPTIAGASIFIPGEPEAISEAARRRSGIPVEEETWRQIVQAAGELGVALPAV